MLVRLLTPAKSVLIAVLPLALAACGGSSGSDSEDNTIAVSGRLSVADGVAVDSDINDIFATYASNDTRAEAQAINSLLSVQGFVNAEGTDGDVSGYPELERFDDATDVQDFYLVNLAAAQTVNLRVIDYSFSFDDPGYYGDVDLQVLDANGNSVAISHTDGPLERITVTSAGQYYIRVYAFEGASKYILSFDSASTSSRNTTAVNQFVPGEMLVQSSDKTAASATATARSILSQRGLQASNSDALGHRGPTLVQFDIPSASTQHASPLLNGTAVDDTEGDYEAKFQTIMAIKAVAKQDGVELAEPNYIRQPLATTPNDTLYRYQWDLDIIDLPDAWDITTGERADGVDVVVAVIDTGIYMDHPDLSGQLTSDGYDFISDTNISNDGDGIDADPDDPGDSNLAGQSSWHGTHVAGTIAAASNNSTGIAGIAWDAKIMPVRVLGVGGGKTSDIVQGMYYAAGLSNSSGTLPTQTADIINMSLGGTESSTFEANAVSDIYDAGVLVVAASGNDGTSEINYPAGYDHVIAVGATDGYDNITDYSNFGSHLDLSAPGGDISADAQDDDQADGIVSTVADDTNGSREAAYALYEGTSMAAPHVAGVLALMKAVYPAITVENVEALIANGYISDDLGAEGKDNYHGYGRINALKAVTWAQTLANGGSVDLPVILDTDPDTLAIGQQDSATFEISNRGAGDPTITSVTTTASWLSISPASVDADGFGSYTATVDRSDLADGSYSTEIRITSTSSDSDDETTLPVTMQVGDFDTEGEMVQQYVLLLDENGATVDTVRADANGNYQFGVADAGNYYILAGSDIDVDNHLCTAGETCGHYPNTAEPELITVAERAISGLDFEVDLQTTRGVSYRRQSKGTSSDSTVINKVISLD